MCKAAKEGGCKVCHIVSSTGANASSSFTYAKTKGRIEESLKGLGFARLCIYRPGALTGGDRDSTAKKVIYGCLNVILLGNLGSIDVNQVGKFMRVTALKGGSGVEVYENKQMLKA